MAFVTQAQLDKVVQTLDQTPLSSKGFQIESRDHPAIILTVTQLTNREHKAVLFFGDGRAESLEAAIAAGPGKYTVCAELRPGALNPHDRLVNISFAVFLEQLESWATRVSSKVSSTGTVPS